MTIPICPLGSNPFFEAFLYADTLGKLIFLGLVTLSVISWVLIIHKVRLTKRVHHLADHFKKHFEKQAQQPLHVDYQHQPHREFPHPFYDLYQVLRKHTVEILNKNRLFAENARIALPEGSSFLSPSDVELVESHLISTITSTTKSLEKNLFILSTIVTLAPFLGLLGTVWGILTSFSEMQAHTGGDTSQMVLHGLSLALATTVLGLIDAIPALIGYNYLKSRIKDFQIEMDNFASNILATVELHYRKVDAV